MNAWVIEVLGWVGAVLIALAYFLLVHHDLSSRSRPYQLMNLIGAVCIGVNAFTNKAYPSAATNVVWFLIAIYGLVKGFKKNNAVK